VRGAALTGLGAGAATTGAGCAQEVSGKVFATIINTTNKTTIPIKNHKNADILLLIKKIFGKARVNSRTGLEVRVVVRVEARALEESDLK
jgi:hypothetical protein